MRILAIRGQNLASLAERFDIDFEAPPLRGAGLFAITGETGAGKSTILDALCLALYDAFPRVAAQGANETIPEPGGQAMNASDPRSILRRGAASGFAEVDFVGRDGARYRARCDLARARGKASGKLQQRGRALYRLDDDGVPSPLASGVEPVRAKIVELTDLTFDQFRRTVLLAQGDFDAFLRSDSRERADLLEKITGASIYAEISRRIYKRAKEACDRTAELRRRRADVDLLPEEERRALEDEGREAEEKRARLARARDAAVETLRRLEQIAQAEKLLAEATARHAEACAARDGLAGARARLADLSRAEPLREALARRRESEAALESARSAEAEKGAAAEKAQEALDGALERETQSSKILAEAEAAFDALLPEWTRAERLDSEIGVATAEEEKARGASESAERRARELGARKADFFDQSEKTGAEFEAARERLAALSAAAPLAERWDEIEETLARRAHATTSLATGGTRAADLEREIAAHEARLSALDDKDAAARAEREDLGKQIESRSDALAALCEEEAFARSRDLDAAVRSIDSLALEAKRFDAGKTAHENALRDLLAATEAEESERRKIENAHAALDELEARSDEAERLGELADAASSKAASTLRARLVEGEPCPVCGASEHPHAQDKDGAADAFVIELRARRDQLRGAIAKARETIADARGRLAEAEARTADAGRRRDSGAAERDEAARRYESLCGAWPSQIVSVVAPRIEDGPGALATIAERLALEREALGEKLGNAKILRADIDALRKKFDRLGEALEQRRKERDEAAPALEDLRSEAARLSASLEACARDLRRIDDKLAQFLVVCGLEGADLDRDAAGAGGRMKAKAEEFADARARVAELEARVAELDKALVAAGSQAQAADSAATERKEEWKTRSGALDALRRERAQLLGGEETAGHRARFDAARRTAREAFESALREKADAATKNAEATSGRAHAAQALESARARHEEAARGFARALASSGFEEAAALALLGVTDEERAGLRVAIDEAEKAVVTAESERDARLADFSALLADGRPREDRSALEARRAEADEALAALDRRRGEIAARLGADDAARERDSSFAAQIAAAEASQKTWEEVDAAIGSADGAKFRRFAQSVTLDHLVALANRHLSALSTRYFLERAQGEAGDLGLQIVDRDLGDERRSTRSLSGGERFLASLALALGLCGLEGRGSFVDTLFIDEGFGTLDSTTLDVAIDALEALQGQGRKVGLISHVESLHQRIPVQIRVEKRGGGKSVVLLGARAIGVA